MHGTKFAVLEVGTAVAPDIIDVALDGALADAVEYQGSSYLSLVADNLVSETPLEKTVLDIKGVPAASSGATAP